jgi:DNA-directed RNA polymerase specialized sigma24 family protein
MVRAGNAEAFSALCDRHLAAARRLARLLVSPPAAADEVVAEVFARILEATRLGGGPANAVRPYVLTAVRRVSSERHDGEPAELPPDARTRPDLGEPFIDQAVSGVENALIARAFLSLPERWRAVLWHTQVEQASPAEVATMLGLTRNGVVALSGRALDGLRQAYLRAHVARITQPACRPVVERLGAHLRDKLSVRDTALVSEHLARCESCPVVYQELTNVDAGLRGVVAPLILGAAAAGYLASAGSGSSPPSGATAALPAATPRSAPLALGPGRHAAPMGGRVLAAGTAARATDTASPTPDGRATASAASGMDDDEGGGATTTVLAQPDAFRRRRRRATAFAAGVVLAVACASAAAFALTGNGNPPATANQPSASFLPATGTQPGLPAASSPRAGRSRSTTPTRRPSPSSSPRLVAAPPPAPTTTAPTTSPGSATTARLTASISIHRVRSRNPDHVDIQVTNPGSARTGTVTASVTLPAGVSLGGGTGGNANQSSFPGSGDWSCQSTQTGATCTVSGLAAGQSAQETIFVTISDSACGLPVQLSVTSGKLTAAASQGISC